MTQETPTTNRMKEATEEDSAEAASNEEYNFKNFQELVDQIELLTQDEGNNNE